MNRGDKISSTECLYRRGYNSPLKKYLNPDGTAISRVFKLREKDNGKLSVNIASMTTPEKAIDDSRKYNLFSLQNKIVESIGLVAIYDADYENEDNSHSLIIGLEMEDETKPVFLAKNSIKVLPK